MRLYKIVAFLSFISLVIANSTEIKNVPHDNPKGQESSHVESSSSSFSTHLETVNGETEKNEAPSAAIAQTTNKRAETISSAQAETASTLDGKTEQSKTQAKAVAMATNTSDGEEHSESEEEYYSTESESSEEEMSMEDIKEDYQSEEANRDSDVTSQSVRITNSDTEKTDAIEDTSTNEEDNVQHADVVKTEHDELNYSKRASQLTVTQVGSTGALRTGIDNKTPNELTVTQAGSTSSQSLVTSNNEVKTTDDNKNPRNISPTSVRITDEEEKYDAVKTTGNAILSSKESDYKDEKDTTQIREDKFETSLIENSEETCGKRDSSIERKGRYDLSQVDGTEAIHKAILMDMKYKTLVVDDGTGAGKCYCSCDLNRRPVFVKMESLSSFL